MISLKILKITVIYIYIYIYTYLIDLKKKPVKETNVEVSMRAREEELKNSDKQTKNLFFEYEKL